ncbi:hypothetical protein HPP92_028621 [Vanilla planifolia]|uniref:Gamma tubulin complex component C-terminal domain-containing protein n=1 Tax=Vanilla planifolia TaxID=51239 RepID=A0A835P6L4_VANPL|nr:hypothetical protein HPP92_028621 [Vanilla planifolia]
MDSSKDLDDLLIAHEKYLNSIVEKSLLGERSHGIIRTLFVLFDHILCFRSLADRWFETGGASPNLNQRIPSFYYLEDFSSFSTKVEDAAMARVYYNSINASQRKILSAIVGIYTELNVVQIGAVDYLWLSLTDRAVDHKWPD